MGGRGVSSFTNGVTLRFGSGLGTRVDETLKEAIGAKGEPMGIALAASGANPLFNEDSPYAEYSANCQRVVVAYELRRRGYDVVAQPTYKGDVLGGVAHVDHDRRIIYSRWTGAFKGAKVESVGGHNGEKMIANIEKAMSDYGNGSRAVLQVQWRNGGAHVFNVERRNGSTVYIDAQINKQYNAVYLMNSVKPGSANIVRTDNLKLSDRAKNSVTTRRY